MSHVVVLVRMRKTILLLASVVTAVVLALLGAAQPAGAEPSVEEGKIPFAKYDVQNDAFDLQTMNPDGSGTSSFSPSVVGRSPEWSPDGTKFAYVVPAFINEPNAGGIVISSADGAQKTPVPNTVPNSETGPSAATPQVGELAWSPDGEKLAFTVDIQVELCCDENGFPTVRDSADLYTINVDGSDLTNLRNDVPPEEVAFAYPSWSPDGSKIAFSADVGQIGIVNTDGTGQPTGLAEPALGRQPAWSPDGSKIAFVGPDQDLHVANADGTGQRKVTTDGGLISGGGGTPGAVVENSPEWSPDGTKLVFSGAIIVCEPSFPTPICNPNGSDIFTIGIDGSEERNLTNTVNVIESEPSWQPVFPDTTAPEVSETSPPDKAFGVPATDNITATFVEEGSGINENTLDTGFKVEQVKPKGNVPIQGEVTYNSPTATFNPDNNLPKGLYRVTLTGVADNAGNVMPDYTWTFTTAGPPKK